MRRLVRQVHAADEPPLDPHLADRQEVRGTGDLRRVGDDDLHRHAGERADGGQEALQRVASQDQNLICEAEIARRGAGPLDRVNAAARRGEEFRAVGGASRRLRTGRGVPACDEQSRNREDARFSRRRRSVRYDRALLRQFDHPS